MTISIIDPDNGSPTPDYTDVRIWSNADRDLVTATDTEEGEIRPTSGGACTVTNDELEWGGYTTNDTYYIEMRAHADHKHSGKVEASPSYARVDLDSTTTWHSVNMNKHVHVHDLQIVRQGVSGAGQMFSFGRDGHEREVVRCLCHAPESTETVNRWIAGSGSGDLALTVVNNVVTGYFDCGLHLWFDGDHCDGAVYNNTIQHNGDSLECLAYNEGSTYRRPDTKNNICENLGSAGDIDLGGITLITTASNYTSDATSPDGASYQNTAPTYVDQANYDLHLASGDDGNFEGTDLSSDGTYSFSDDIDGDSRNDWDAGADEYIATGGLDDIYFVNMNRRGMDPILQM